VIGRLAILSDFAVPLPYGVPTPKGTSGAVNPPPALAGEPAATPPNADILSAFAQIIQQIAGEPVNPQGDSKPESALPQPTTPPSQGVAASPARNLGPYKPEAEPIAVLPPVPSVHQGAKIEPAPAKAAKSVSGADPAPVALEIESATPVMQTSAPPRPQKDAEAESPESIAQEMKPAARMNPHIEAEAAVLPAATPVEAGRPPSPIHEITPAVPAHEAPEPAPAMPLKPSPRPASPAVHAAEKQLAADQPGVPGPDPTSPGAVEAPTVMDVRSVAPEPVSAPLPPETGPSRSSGLAKSAIVPALMKPSLRTPAAPTRTVRQTKAASPEVKPGRTAPPAAPLDIPRTVQPPELVTPPASPPALTPERARHDTSIQPMPAVQLDAKLDPGPAAVELKFRPQDQPVDRIVQQMRAEPPVNSVTTAPALHAAETAPAPAEILQSIPNVASAYANPNIMGVTQPSVMPQNAIGKPDPPSVPAAHTADVLPDQSKQATPPLRSISLDFAPDGAQDVHVRLAERGGDVHVSLHSADSAFAGRIADGVQDLVGALANAGYDAQAWTPGQERQNQRQQQEPQQQRDETNEGSEEFSAMMQQPNEEVS
jgi:hypothetical protein